MNVENTMCSGGGPNLQEMEGWKWSKRSTSQQSELSIYGDLSQHILVY